MTHRLLGFIKLTENSDLEKYKYSGYGIRSNPRSTTFIYRWKHGEQCHSFWS